MKKTKFNCFSLKLNQFLLNKGKVPVHSFIHHSTKKVCFVYIMDDELQELLNEWKNTKN